MQKNSNLTQLDPNQIATKEHDASTDAKRVIIVGGEKFDIAVDSDKIVNAVRDGLSTIKFNQSSESKEVQIIEKNIFIPQIEIREIEKQIFIPQIEYRTIEIPIITEKIVTVERPVIIREVEVKEVFKERFVPQWQKICIYLQTAIAVAFFILHILRKN